MTNNSSPDGNKFQKLFDVSHETIENLEQYASILTKWNQRINLVSPSTLPNVWQRHMVDSAQLWQHCPINASNWLDIGSGAGFPALVLAIMAQNSRPNLKFTLVESDQRKSAFLLNVAHALGLSIDIQAKRIENLTQTSYDVISARALAPLTDLLNLAKPFCNNSTICLFPKGAKHESELTIARKIWHIEHEQIQSMTDAQAVILRIESFSRA